MQWPAMQQFPSSSVSGCNTDSIAAPVPSPLTHIWIRDLSPDSPRSPYHNLHFWIDGHLTN